MNLRTKRSLIRSMTTCVQKPSMIMICTSIKDSLETKEASVTINVMTGVTGVIFLGTRKLLVSQDATLKVLNTVMRFNAVNSMMNVQKDALKARAVGAGIGMILSGLSHRLPCADADPSLREISDLSLMLKYL